jgi:hypothetical protein
MRLGLGRRRISTSVKRRRGSVCEPREESQPSLRRSRRDFASDQAAQTFKSLAACRPSTQRNFYRARSSFAIAKAATCGAFRRIPEAFASLGERMAWAVNFPVGERGIPC